MTSLAFIFELVPEPVWNTSIGKCSSCSPAATVSAGTVPADGATPLTLDYAGGIVTASWASSCSGGASGYAVYQGTLTDLRGGSFAPTPVTCLAGVDLTFDVEVTDVRDATDDEVAHGHAHGPGGAHD